MKYKIYNLLIAISNGAGYAPRDSHPCMVLIQPPNAVTRSRREYHYCVRVSLLAERHICNYGKNVTRSVSGLPKSDLRFLGKRKDNKTSGVFCVTAKTEQVKFVLTSWRIFHKARHGRNVFVCLFCRSGLSLSKNSRHLSACQNTP